MPSYEPNEHDIAAASEQATRIAREFLEAQARGARDPENLLAAKIEAAILAELVDRGQPREPVQIIITGRVALDDGAD